MRTVSRHLLVTLGVVTALLASGTGAVADTPGAHSGLYGVHFLQDSAEYTGAHCFYGNDQVIRRVRVRFPIVYARDRTPARDSQSVAWRFNLQRSPDGEPPWTTVHFGSFQRVSTSDDTPARFTAMSHTFTDGIASGYYRVLVGMHWHQPGSTTISEGNVTHIVDWYAGAAFTPAGACPGGVF